MAGMTFDERVIALAPLGLPPRQTAFLVTVALHGGYCVRRQFGTFTGRAHGQVTHNFFDQLVDKDLATPIVYQPNRAVIFHVPAKALYRALRQDDNRNRCAVGPALIARKLMVLDYVLTRPAVDWLATEQDKVAWFAAQPGVALADLPQRRYDARGGGSSTTRYFIHKLPIWIEPNSQTVEFVHLVLDATGRHFERFLRDHLRLVSRLPRWRIALVTPSHLRNGARVCEKVFSEMFTRAATVRSHWTRDDRAFLCRIRRSLESNDFRGVSVRDLDRFRDLKAQIPAAEAERLYVEWERHGDAALDAPATRTAPPVSRPSLIQYELPSRYAQFGSLPGIA